MKRTTTTKWTWNYSKGKKYGFPDVPDTFKVALKDPDFYNYFFTCYVNFIENEYPQLQCVVPSWLESRLGGRFLFIREGEKVKVLDDNGIAEKWISENPLLRDLAESLNLKVENVEYN